MKYAIRKKYNQYDVINTETNEIVAILGESKSDKEQAERMVKIYNEEN